jgi:hypothetical protein
MEGDSMAAVKILEKKEQLDWEYDKETSYTLASANPRRRLASISDRASWCVMTSEVTQWWG